MTSVPDRSLTVMLSGPPRALKSTISTSSVLIVTFPGWRKKTSRPPLAVIVTCSLPGAPLNSIVSVPLSPSIESLPSPGSHWNVSSPRPRSARSLPRPPSTKSSPLPPLNASTPAPPFSVSSPFPPAIDVGMASVNEPFASSMRTESRPLPIRMLMAPTLARANEKSAEPLSPASTWIRV